MSSKVSKEEIRPIYSQLQGILSQTPKESTILHDNYWNFFHEAIHELNEVSGKDYSRFIVPESTIKLRDGRSCKVVGGPEFRQRVSGLISRLYGEYFSTEPPPFSGMPGVVVHQTQNQTQTSIQYVILDFAVQLGQKIEENKNDPQKVGFLNGLKGGLSSVKDIGDLIKGIAGHAREFSLGMEDILNIFS